RVKRTLDVAVVAVFLGAAACGSTDDASTAPTTPTTDKPAATTALPLAEQIMVDEIAVYQAVKATIVSQGSIVAKPNAPVIANRPAVVRVFVKAIDRARPTIEGELVLKTPGKPDLVLRDGNKKVASSQDDDQLG